jgi:hypothetical protein
MKLTTEEREQFFALYWGQLVMQCEGDNFLITNHHARWNCEHHLSLKSLSSISEASLSDEDAIEVAKMIGNNSPIGCEPYTLHSGLDFIKWFIYDGEYESFVPPSIWIRVIDYLRRKGYLLGATLMNKEGVCTHYTAEELIEDGIAKIRE